MRIENATLATNNKQLQFGNFNVFIGGNAVGKTTFLMELHARVAAVTRNKFHWILEVKCASDNVQEDMKLLKGSMSVRYEGVNKFYFSRASKDISGNVDLTQDHRFMENEIIEMPQMTAENIFINNVKYRKPFVALLSCDARLSFPDNVGINPLDQPPQDAINLLYRQKKLLKEISTTIEERFRLKFIMLEHTASNLQIGLSTENAPPFDRGADDLQEEFHKTETWKRDKFATISEAGHGIRSMIKILASLFEPVNQIIVIDEPELHLYPSHKRWLGKIMVELARLQRKQVFLVTHDPIVLQGVLDARVKTNINRVDRNNDVGAIINECQLDNIIDVDAQKNQDQYLQGLFYQRCIVVEGASDRSFYQNLIENIVEIADKDLGFVACGGKGGTKHMATIVTKVGLQAAFIYDFDALLIAPDVVRDVYHLLGGDDDPLATLEELFKSNLGMSRSDDNKKEFNKKIRELTGYRDKEGITSEWAKQNRQAFDIAIQTLSVQGIFIVPKGTLESWAPEVEPKVRFAELAPEFIRQDESLKTAFREFATRVLSYLSITISS